MSASGSPLDDATALDGGSGGAWFASGKALNRPALVVGRESELERLRGLLAEAAAGRCTALLVEGEAGVGKTTLLGSVRSLADGFCVLTAQGLESESQLACAGLLELLRPIRDLLPEVPDAQAEALGAALGWSAASTASSGADRFLVAAATLSLLAARAERGPVLVLVDDLQWLDGASSDAILFAARRLGSDAVGLVLAARTGHLPAELRQGLPALRLGGLSVSAAAELLPEVGALTVERLVVGTDGNPLALLEVAQRLDDAQRLGSAPLPDPLPAGERLRTLHLATLAALSPPAFQAVLLLAVAGATATATSAVAGVLGSSGADPVAALDEARKRGVVVRDGARYRFRHPLLRSAVLELAMADQLLASHAALAAVLPVGDSARVWHRAHSTIGTDAGVAQELAQLADADRHRLGYDAASAALQRAGDLTPDPALAAQRLALAAHDAFLAGDIGRVRALADRVLSGTATDRARGEVLFTLGMLEQYAGSVPVSVEHLSAATTLLDGAPLVRALTELAVARFRLNDIAGLVQCAQLIDASADRDDPEQQLLAHFTGGAALVLAGDFDAGVPRLDEVLRLADLPALRHDARVLLLMALAAAFTGQVRDAVTVGTARVQEVRRRGAIGALVPLLAILAAGKAWLGDHAGAFADAGEAAELAAHLGYAADASVAVEMLAWQLAARGQHEEASRALLQARTLTDRAGTTSAAAHQALTSAFCALSRRDPSEAAALLEHRLDHDGGVGASGEPLGVAPLLVEAYVGLGRWEDARSLTARFADVTAAEAAPLSRALLLRCQAMTADDEDAAREAFDAAMAAHAAASDPFEAARTRLLYGGRLRRAGQRIAARGELSAARDAFQTMELTHWSAVAAEELAATGATVRRGPVTGDVPLTSQETRVTLLAAQGLSNREIGASLFLSPKTVERHLSSVFRKRGFRSRTQLAASFARSTE